MASLTEKRLRLSPRTATVQATEHGYSSNALHFISISASLRMRHSVQSQTGRSFVPSERIHEAGVSLRMSLTPRKRDCRDFEYLVLIKNLYFLALVGGKSSHPYDMGALARQGDSALQYENRTICIELQHPLETIMGGRW